MWRLPIQMHKKKPKYTARTNTQNKNKNEGSDNDENDDNTTVFKYTASSDSLPIIIFKTATQMP